MSNYKLTTVEADGSFHFMILNENQLVRVVGRGDSEDRPLISRITNWVSSTRLSDDPLVFFAKDFANRDIIVETF